MVALVTVQHLAGRREPGVVLVRDSLRLAQPPDVLPGRELVAPPLVPQPDLSRRSTWAKADVDHGVDLVLLQGGEKVVVVPAGGTDGEEGLHGR